jgi:hypothetical protein
VKQLVRRRPTEVVSGLALAGTLYAFLAGNGVPQLVAVSAAAVVAFGPGALSRFVDAVRRPRT